MEYMNDSQKNQQEMEIATFFSVVGIVCMIIAIITEFFMFIILGGIMLISGLMYGIWKKVGFEEFSYARV